MISTTPQLTSSGHQPAPHAAAAADRHGGHLPPGRRRHHVRRPRGGRVGGHCERCGRRARVSAGRGRVRRGRPCGLDGPAASAVTGARAGACAGGGAGAAARECRHRRRAVCAYSTGNVIPCLRECICVQRVCEYYYCVSIIFY